MRVCTMCGQPLVNHTHKATTKSVRVGRKVRTIRSGRRQKNGLPLRRKARGTAALVGQANKPVEVRAKHQVVLDPPISKVVGGNTRLDRTKHLNAVEKLRESTLRAKRAVSFGRHEKSKLPLRRRARRMLTSVGKVKKTVELQAKLPVILHPAAPKTVVGNAQLDRTLEKGRDTIPRAKRAVSFGRRKKKMHSLRRRVRRAATPVAQANKPMDLQVKPQVVLDPPAPRAAVSNARSDRTAGLGEPRKNMCDAASGADKPTAGALPGEKQVVHKRPSRATEKAGARAGKRVARKAPASRKGIESRVDRAARLERRVTKLEEIFWKDKKGTNSDAQAPNNAKLEPEPALNLNPQPDKTVIVNELVASAVALDQPAESGEDAVLRADRTADAAPPTEKKVVLNRLCEEVPAIGGEASNTVDVQAEPPAEFGPQAVKSVVADENANIGVAQDEPPKNPKETNMIADKTSSAAASAEETMILDEPSEETPDQPALAGKVVVRDIATDLAEGLEAQLEPAVDLACQVEGIQETDWNAGNGVGTGGQDVGPAGRKRRFRKQVLVIDDDATMRMLLKMGLGSQDYDCLTAENGKAAQAVLQTHRPDLILVDLLMPVMDGLSFIQWLRQTAQDSTPVLVFTNVDTPRITQEALASGANSFACKPLHLKELLEVMNQLVPN